MKKHKAVGIVVFALLVACPLFLHAATLGRPLGGRVLTGPAELQTSIVCAAAYGPFLMLPYNIAGSGPYFIRATTAGTPRRGGHLLGLYKFVPDLGTCTNPETGAPVPAFEIRPYGVSR